MTLSAYCGCACPTSLWPGALESLGPIQIEALKSWAIIKTEALEHVVGEKRIYKLVWQLTGQSFAKLSLSKYPSDCIKKLSSRVALASAVVIELGTGTSPLGAGITGPH